VGGVDSLCLTTLYGFNSLQLLSSDICRPADAKRNGISIGEAAGFALLDPRAPAPVHLLGYGETSDAYHMSSPDPDGLGAVAAMRAALAWGGVGWGGGGDGSYVMKRQQRPKRAVGGGRVGAGVRRAGCRRGRLREFARYRHDGER